VPEYTKLTGEYNMDMNTLVLVIILIAVIYILIKKLKISKDTRKNTIFYLIDYEERFLPRLKFDTLFKDKKSMLSIDIFKEMLQKFLDASYKLYYIDKTIKEITDIKTLSEEDIAELFFKSINDCKSDVWLLITKKEKNEVQNKINQTYNTKNNYYLNYTLEESISMFVMYSSDALEFLMDKNSIDEIDLVHDIVDTSKMKYIKG